MLPTKSLPRLHRTHGMQHDRRSSRTHSRFENHRPGTLVMGEYRTLDVNEVLHSRPPSDNQPTQAFIAAWNVLLLSGALTYHSPATLSNCCTCHSCSAEMYFTIGVPWPQVMLPYRLRNWRLTCDWPRPDVLGSAKPRDPLYEGRRASSSSAE